MNDDVNGVKMSKAERFKRLLPEIYKKLIKEGMKYDQCAEWLLETHNLDMFSQNKNNERKPTLLATYMRLYGNLKGAKKAYEDFLKSKEGNWWEDGEASVSNEHTEVTTTTSSPNISQPKQADDKKPVPPLISDGNLSKKLNLSPDPKKDIPDPMAGYNPHKLRNKTNN